MAAHGFLQMPQGAWVACQYPVGWHGVAAFAHPLRHPAHQLLCIVHTHHEQHGSKPRGSGGAHELQFGGVGEHGFAHERVAGGQQRGAALVGPGSGLFGARFRLGHLRQVGRLKQVGVDEFQLGRDQTFCHCSAVQGGFAGAVGAGQQVKNR